MGEHIVSVLRENHFKQTPGDEADPHIAWLVRLHNNL